MPEPMAPPATPSPPLAFDLSGEQQATLEAASEYARRELYPLAPRMDAEEWWPASRVRPARRRGLSRRHGAGALRRRGRDLFTSALVLQGFSRWNHALGLAWVAHDNLCVNNIYRNANDEQRRRYLPGLCSGAAGRRARPDRTGGGLRRPGVDAHHAPGATVITTC